jgi:hypothetical protein
MVRILSYGESTLVALLQIKVLDPVRAFCRSFRLNSPKKGRGAGAGGPLLPFPMSPARTRASAMRNYHHCKPRCCGPSRYSSPSNSLSSHRVRRYHKARGRARRPAPCRGAAEFNPFYEFVTYPNQTMRTCYLVRRKWIIEFAMSLNTCVRLLGVAALKKPPFPAQFCSWVLLAPSLPRPIV